MAKFKLPADRVQALQQAQREIHDILPVIDDAEKCGIECQQYRVLVDEVNERITKILQYFGPASLQR